jgi:hypothetical protein
MIALATAQVPTPSPSPEPQASPTSTGPVTFQLEVDQNDIAALSAALMELPKKVADPLISKLNAQIQKQVVGKSPEPAK